MTLEHQPIILNPDLDALEAAALDRSLADELTVGMLAKLREVFAYTRQLEAAIVADIKACSHCGTDLRGHCYLHEATYEALRGEA